MAESFVTEDALSAIVKVLIDPVLARLNHYAEAAVGEEEISQQMEAIAWLYNHFLCRDFPHLEFLHASVLWRKTILLRPRLIRYMGQTKGGLDAFLTMTLTERKVTDACNVSKALRNPSDSKIHLASNVCVCLLDSKLERCVLVLGSVTIGVWSFIEKSADSLVFDKEQELKGKHRKKRKKTNNTKEASDERPQMMTCADPMGIAFSALKEQIGVESNVLQVEEELVVHHENTHFFIMRCKEEVNLAPALPLEKVVWVPVDEALSQAEGPLLVKAPLGLYATSAVHHFRIRPFCPTIRFWFSRRGLEMLKSEYGRNASASECAAIMEFPVSSVQFSSHGDVNVIPPPISLNELDVALHTLEVNPHVLGGRLSSNSAANRKSDSFREAGSAALEPVCMEPALKKSGSEHCTKEKAELSVCQSDTGVKLVDSTTDNIPVERVQGKDLFTGQNQPQSEIANLQNLSSSFAFGKQADSSMPGPLSGRKDHNATLEMVDGGQKYADISMPRPLSVTKGRNPALQAVERGRKLIGKELKMVTGESGKKLSHISLLHNDLDMITKELTTGSLQKKERVEGNSLPRHEIQSQLENEKLQISDTTISSGWQEQKATRHLDYAGDCLSLLVTKMHDTVEDIYNKQTGDSKELIVTTAIEKNILDAAMLENGHIIKSHNLQLLPEGDKLRKHKRAQTECIKLQKQTISTASKLQEENILEVPASAGQFEDFVDSIMHNTDIQPIQKKREAYMKDLTELIAKYQSHTNCLIKQIKDCDKKILKHLGGSKDHPKPAMNLFSDKSIKRKKSNKDSVLEEASLVQPCELSLGQTDMPIADVKRKPLSRDAICKAINSTQELRSICMKNLWPLPSYSIFAISDSNTGSSYYGRVRLRGTDFELSETGELCSSTKEARASAAAYMLSALYSLRARNGI